MSSEVRRKKLLQNCRNSLPTPKVEKKPHVLTLLSVVLEVQFIIPIIRRQEGTLEH